jgi:sugar lactone lactonase YvrE
MSGIGTSASPVACSTTVGVLSEGPRWDGERGELLWVDIVGSRLHRARVGADGMLDELAELQFDRFVGAVAPVLDVGYVLAAGGGFLFADASGMVVELVQPEGGRDHIRMNDGACDSNGRFWAGTMAHDESPGAGVLYRLELDGACTTVVTGLTISNGIGWSPDGTEMYLSDSGTATVDVFDFEADSGELGARRTIVEITDAGVAPDGLTVDDDGNVWVALWGGGAVRCYSPRGALLRTVPVPADRPTSCAFGGADRSTLFITTARHGLDDAALTRQPDAGRVFRVDGLGVSGPPCAPYRGRIVQSCARARCGRHAGRGEAGWRYQPQRWSRAGPDAGSRRAADARYEVLGATWPAGTPPLHRCRSRARERAATR